MCSWISRPRTPPHIPLLPPPHGIKRTPSPPGPSQSTQLHPVPLYITDFLRGRIKGAVLNSNSSTSEFRVILAGEMIRSSSLIQNKWLNVWWKQRFPRIPTLSKHNFCLNQRAKHKWFLFIIKYVALLFSCHSLSFIHFWHSDMDFPVLPLNSFIHKSSFPSFDCNPVEGREYTTGSKFSMCVWIIWGACETNPPQPSPQRFYGIDIGQFLELFPAFV